MLMIKTENLRKVYNPKSSSPVKALKGVSLSVEKGEMVAIQGPSGCGKSTLLHILGCLDDPTEGEYYFNDSKVSFSNNSTVAKLRNKDIGFILQSYGLIGERSVFDNVVIPLIFANLNISREEKRVAALLDKLGIAHLKKNKCNDLSGGEKQRTAIARALVNQPKILLADEPTGALDSTNGKQCIELLKSINAEGTTIIIVTHDDSIASYCNRIIRMKDGLIA
jgi:putative ABC transport system ATP-binding protein